MRLFDDWINSIASSDERRTAVVLHITSWTCLLLSALTINLILRSHFEIKTDVFLQSAASDQGVWVFKSPISSAIKPGMRVSSKNNSAYFGDVEEVRRLDERYNEILVRMKTLVDPSTFGENGRVKIGEVKIHQMLFDSMAF